MHSSPLKVYGYSVIQGIPVVMEPKSSLPCSWT